MSSMTDFIKDTIDTLATPAQYRKAIAAFAGPALSALALTLSDGNLTRHEVLADLGVGLAGFVTTFFTPPNKR